MAADGPILVTRPEGQVQGLQSALEGQGLHTRHLPLLAIEATDPLPGTEHQKILDLDLFDHLIFVSANAARIGLERIDEYWPQMPMGQRYWAVGVSTAKVLERAGLVAARPETDMSSEGLLAMPGLMAVDGQRILIVRGEGGRTLIADTLTERGANVSSLCCYRRGPVPYEQDRLLREFTAEPPSLVLISSGEGLSHLSGLLSPQEHTTLARIALVVPSPRVAEQARAQGWREVMQADNASDEAMLAAVQAWRSVISGRDSIDRQETN